jgi:hypothetical protein
MSVKKGSDIVWDIMMKSKEKLPDSDIEAQFQLLLFEHKEFHDVLDSSFIVPRDPKDFNVKRILLSEEKWLQYEDKLKAIKSLMEKRNFPLGPHHFSEVDYMSKEEKLEYFLKVIVETQKWFETLKNVVMEE